MLLKEFESWTDKFLQFVMKDRSVKLLKPVSWEAKKMSTLNTKGHSIIIHLSSVEEIWFESETN
jgi:hypothetical protein